jgi:hypothetical protein
MKTSIAQTQQITSQAKQAAEPQTISKPYILWTRTSRADLLNLEVIDGFMRDNKTLHFSRQIAEPGKLIVEFERVNSMKMNNYFLGEILNDLAGIQHLVIRITDKKSLVSETITSLSEIN